jgi:glutathione S-transferase
MQGGVVSELTLVTFPPSLDSELSRFLLDHYGVAHREQRHTLVFCSVVTLVRARTPLFPVLYGKGVRMDRVLDMMGHFEKHAPPELRLLPAQVDRQRAREDWKLFHHTLGSGTTVFAYYHLLPHREIMVGPLSDGTPSRERAAVRKAYPFFSGLLRLLLRLTPARELAARAKIQDVMTAVDARLADGRRYLHGDVFSLSDMSFAVAAAPVVWPDEYGGAVPRFEEIPPALREMVLRMRQRPSGAHALRVFREHRARRVPPRADAAP